MDIKDLKSVIASTKDPVEEEPPKISAYFSLVFPNFTYYLQTVNVTIGRRCNPPVSSSSSADYPNIDVDLGPLKSVSRLHARIEYEEEEERFVLVVVGRNGAWVDGVWSGSGSRVPLGERSQIQIASRTFHFVLPPIIPQEESNSYPPSPSSQSSPLRARSPSVDITSISPPSPLTSHSPPPVVHALISPKIPPKEGLLPADVPAAKPKAASKKRKKPEIEPRPRPEVMPPKPQFTYAQLCYRAIKALGGKATLQDICQWMMETYDWYHFNQGAGWENSVRHNLSSNRAFKKMERCGGERGKGFFWSLDEKFEHTFEEQEAKSQANATNVGKSDGKKKKERAGASLLDPPLKRSVKGELKGTPLPPPLTSVPLIPKSSITTPYNPATPFSYANTYNLVKPLPVELSSVSLPIKPEPSGSSQPVISPPSQPLQPATNITPKSGTSAATSSFEPGSNPQSSSAIHNLPDDVRLPITVGPVPEGHPLATLPPTDPLASFLKTPPIVLADNVLILNPQVFSHLSPEQLKELEALGTRKTLEILQTYIVRFIKEFKKVAKPKKGRLGGGASKKNKQAGTVDSKSDAKASCVTSGPFTTAPLPPRPHDMQNPQNPARMTQASPQNGTASGAVPDIVAKSLVPAPVASSSDPVLHQHHHRSASPIVIIDDEDPPICEDGPVSKRRRLDTPTTAIVGSG